MKRFPQYRYLPFTTRDPENLDPSHPKYVGKQYLQDLFTSGQLAEAAGDDLSPSNTHVFLCGNPAMIGYVPPGGQPLTKPGMLPILRDADSVTIVMRTDRERFDSKSTGKDSLTEPTERSSVQVKTSGSISCKPLLSPRAGKWTSLEQSL